MIKIISGTYGYREGTKVIPKNSDSPPFELTPKREAELVKEGVARYATEKDAQVEADSPAHGFAEYGLEMTFAELKRIAAESYGIEESELKKAKSKAVVIKLIEEAKAAKGTDDDDEEDDEEETSKEKAGGNGAAPPNLTPTDPE